MKKIVLLSLIAAAPLAAQAPAIRLIAAPDAQSRALFGMVPAVRQLPGGKLLVNDVSKRQLTLLDQALGSPVVVADSAAGMANSYGTRPGGLIAYFADSSLFVDPAGLSMFVLDPAGKIARVASVPRSQDAGSIGNNLTGNPGLDAKGRLVYRGGMTFVRNTTTQARPAAGNGPGGFALPDFPDSVALVRVDLASRKVDTAAYFKIPKTKMRMEQTERGMTGMSEQNPLPLVDDWAVLANGSVAIVRGQDYHVDFINADGTITSGSKIPYEWQRLSDDDKVAVIDSAKKALEAARAAGPNAQGGGVAGLFGPGGDGGAPRMVINMSAGGAGDGGGGMAQRVMANGMGASPLGAIQFVSPSELPDYRPVFTTGSAKGDADGNLWVRTTAARVGTPGQIYDVINGRGELIDRIQIPAGRQVIGFGKGGVVYLLARDPSGSWIERTHR
jgi:hypothetical protein